MEPILAILVGVLLAGAVYLMLGRNLVKFLIGLMLLSNAANLTIFAAGRLTWAAPPLIPGDAEAPIGAVANALPQALILTAIVISFGLVAFAMVLAYRAYQEIGTVDTDEMRVAEPRATPAPGADGTASGTAAEKDAA
ncbi:MAG: Na+/H+ antiporter subunit C [Alphaproteobacteria bacterium]|jgi:multicomponent Na+:H+ antiporter subunit C|nr:Na+/H+ antiporter subunit C [Alphaproteobacteria bacterium]